MVKLLGDLLEAMAGVGFALILASPIAIGAWIIGEAFSKRGRGRRA